VVVGVVVVLMMMIKQAKVSLKGFMKDYDVGNTNSITLYKNKLI
jgi:hypothetical protein